MRPPYAVIDSHVYIVPWEQMRADAAASLAGGRSTMDEIHALGRDPCWLVDHMDARNIEKLVMINYVTPEVDDFCALPLAEETKRRILRDNALKLFEKN